MNTANRNCTLFRKHGTHVLDVLGASLLLLIWWCFVFHLVLSLAREGFIRRRLCCAPSPFPRLSVNCYSVISFGCPLMFRVPFLFHLHSLLSASTPSASPSALLQIVHDTRERTHEKPLSLPHTLLAASPSLSHISCLILFSFQHYSNAEIVCITPLLFTSVFSSLSPLYL